jgi:hypothetical protein
MADTQISAYISEATRLELERYARANGIKKGHLLEEALLHHLQALRELPSDIILPPRLTVTPESFLRVAAQVSEPREPTKAMRALMRGKPPTGEP